MKHFSLGFSIAALLELSCVLFYLGWGEGDHFLLVLSVQVFKGGDVLVFVLDGTLPGHI